MGISFWTLKRLSLCLLRGQSGGFSNCCESAPRTSTHGFESSTEVLPIYAGAGCGTV